MAVVDLVGQQAATDLAKDLYRALNNHVDLKPLENAGFVTALAGPITDEDVEAIATAKAFKQDADEALALAQPDFRRADTSATKGTLALHYVKPAPEVLGLYADLAFNLGVAQLGQNNANAASFSFALSRRLAPMKQPDPARYLPEIIDAYKAAAAKSSNPAQIDVKGNGNVWLDGIDQGPAPRTVKTTDGPHVVQLIGPERETRGMLVTLPTIKSADIEDAPASDVLKVKRARIELAQTPDAAASASAMKKLAGLLGIGDAVLISKSPADKLLVQTWRDRAPGFSAKLEHGTEKASDLLIPLAPPRKPDPPKEIEPELPPLIIEKRWYQKTWVRASAATGLVALIVTAVLISTQDRMVLTDPNISEAPK